MPLFDGCLRGLVPWFVVDGRWRRASPLALNWLPRESTEHRQRRRCYRKGHTHRRIHRSRPQEFPGSVANHGSRTEEIGRDVIAGRVERNQPPAS